MNEPVNRMFNANRFKLGVFSINAEAGLAITTVPERWRADWGDIVAVTRMAETAGFEFVLPIARWKGFGGITNVRGLSFETLTHGAGLAASTTEIVVFSTVHVPAVHPVFAAKALATVDHISSGRAGLNIVCGWNQDEFDMFGHQLPEHDTRYEQGLEWYDILTRIYGADQPFDYSGTFYNLKGVAGAPAPIQTPRPITISAGFSPKGREFARRTSDFLFTTFSTLEKGILEMDEVRRKSSESAHQIGVFTTCHVVCRPTDREAQEYYRYYAEEKADHAAIDRRLKLRAGFNADDARLERLRYAGGSGSFPLIGSPETIARDMIRIAEAGYAGTTVSFVNFKDELPYFISQILPRLERAGLRRPAC